MAEKLDADLEDLGEWNDSEWPEEDWLELVDYLSNDTSPEARAATKRRLETDPHFARLAAPLLAAWPTPAPSKDHPTEPATQGRDADITQLFERALNAERKTLDDPGTQMSVSASRRTMWTVGTAAAILLTSIAVYVVVQLTTQSSSSTAPATQLRILPPASHDLVLADGSRVTLEPGAALLTGDSAQGRVGTVRLAGSGTFVVQANPQRPFTVENRGIWVVATVASTFRIAVERSTAGTSAKGDSTLDDVANVHVNVTAGNVVVQRVTKGGRREIVSTLGSGEEISVSQQQR